MADLGIIVIRCKKLGIIMSVNYTPEELSKQKKEAIFLILCLVGAIALLVVNYCNNMMNELDKKYVYAAIGGFLGGWSFDVKWFYRVTARGKDNQHPHKWEEHKLYWRIFVPFLSSVVSFAFFCLASSGFIQILDTQNITGSGAFGLCFLLGYFSDATIAKMGELINTLFGNDTNKGS